MSRKKPTTPRSQVRSALRRLWLRSRERAAALKRDKYTCQDCGTKQSKAKGREVAVEVHHLEPVRWEFVLDYIYRHLIVPPELLETLCRECHEKETTNAQCVVAHSNEPVEKENRHIAASSAKAQRKR